MTTRINGMAFDTFIGGTDIHVKSISLDISDESAVAKTRGILTANCAALSVPKVKSK